MTPLSPMEAMYSVFSYKPKNSALPCHDCNPECWERSEIYPIKDPDLNNRITQIFIREILEREGNWY